MAGKRPTFRNRNLGSLLILCALAICVTTAERVVGWLGQDVRLHCNINHTELIAMYWMNSSGISKVSFFRNQPRSFDDRFNLNEDFSMSIRNTMVSDEDKYSCHMELESGQSVTNHTNLAVYALPMSPYIDECDDNPGGNKTHSLCTVETFDTHPFNLECRVTGFRPNVTLLWTSSGIVKQPIGEPFQRKLPDGTWEREISISVTAKVDEKLKYTCTARGEATNGTALSATITVIAHKESFWRRIVYVLVGGIALIVLLVIIYFIFSKDTRKLKSYRKEISRYTFKAPTTPSGSSIKAAHIGVYGQTAAGKSSFVNSIEFAFRGKQSQPIRHVQVGSGGHTSTRIRCRLNLTDYIALFDRRGMKDFSLSYVDGYMKEIHGEIAEEYDEERDQSANTSLLEEEVHCPVFVYKYQFGHKEAMTFLDKFTQRLHHDHGYTTMVVVTHADSLSTDVTNNLKDEITKIIGSENVWFFENYTNSVENRQKSINFLKFLKAALHHCEVSVVNIERQKKVTHKQGGKRNGRWWLLGY